MKIKCLYLSLLTLLVLSYANGADEITRPEEGAKSGRAMLSASQMSLDEDDDDLTEHKGDTSPKVPPLVSTPATLPAPKEPSAKGRSPKVRHHHDSFSGPVVKGGAPKNSK